jgi:8-oxo-dGTP pyrophosphatase MutT (NUDIX family)
MKWKKLTEKILYKNKYFNLKQECCEMPNGTIVPAYFIIDIKDWVNIVAITKDKKIILIEQYRHALGEVMLEIPGGAIDGDESPQTAACRELLEETGFRGKVILEKQHAPNPALQSNRMWTYLVVDCELVATTQFDEHEDIKMHLCSFVELSGLIDDGKIKHSLILASLFLVWKELQSQLDN